jgi:hypothetical protein
MVGRRRDVIAAVVGLLNLGLVFVLLWAEVVGRPFLFTVSWGLHHSCSFRPISPGRDSWSPFLLLIVAPFVVAGHLTSRHARPAIALPANIVATTLAVAALALVLIPNGFCAA